MQKTQNVFDEMNGEAGDVRYPYQEYQKWLETEDPARLHRKSAASEAFFRRTGITFNVYGREEAAERLIPFDIVPRVISGREWARLERGIEQRVRAINAFLHDIYHRQEILRAGRIPRELIANNEAFLPQMIGVSPPGGVYTHIVGTDLVRTGEDDFYVLEDNARTPSGVSYMLENRTVTKRVFPELFENYNIQPITDYPTQLFDTLAAISPKPKDFPEVVVLTPGIFNSAYFEHSYLAQQMGCELVQGSDLYVEDDHVFMKTIEGLAPVDVIYRRIDDLFLDPEVFNPDSALGVPGLMRAWLKGNVGLANAPGAGVADDKVIYTYVPKMIKYYLDEEPILPNVPSFLCTDKAQMQHVIQNLDKLVVKPANESGGYGMLIGPQASKKERAEFARRIRANPREYMAQPLISLSTSPVLGENTMEPRHVDLRPFILQGSKPYVTAGGLTRVAMVKGSYVVNSSQGGGSKDTWIVRE